MLLLSSFCFSLSTLDIEIVKRVIKAIGNRNAITIVRLIVISKSTGGSRTKIRRKKFHRVADTKGCHTFLSATGFLITPSTKKS